MRHAPTLPASQHTCQADCHFSAHLSAATDPLEDCEDIFTKQLRGLASTAPRTQCSVSNAPSTQRKHTSRAGIKWSLREGDLGLNSHSAAQRDGNGVRRVRNALKRFLLPRCGCWSAPGSCSALSFSDFFSPHSCSSQCGSQMGSGCCASGTRPACPLAPRVRCGLRDASPMLPTSNGERNIVLAQRSQESWDRWDAGGAF